VCSAAAARGAEVLNARIAFVRATENMMMAVGKVIPEPADIAVSS
jgi:hypothetical protein